MAETGRAALFTDTGQPYEIRQIPLPEDLPDGMLTPINCALSQVTFGLHKVGLTFGDSVAIQGAGGLGINATMVAREMGASQIIVIDGIPQRLELAKACGADHAIDINEAFQEAEWADKHTAVTRACIAP